MTKSLTTLQINTFLTGTIKIDTDKHSRIIIHEPPEGVVHATELNEVRHQITSMMVFQEKLSMLFRANMKAVGTKLPVPNGKYRIEVKLRSPRKISELPAPTIRDVSPASPLLNVLKSVVDALNKHIISNDSQIYSAEIVYEPVPKGGPSKLDYLEVAFFDFSRQPAALIAQIATDVYVIPKEPPLIYYADNKPVVLQDYHHKDFAAQLRPIMNLPKYDRYHIDIQFDGDVERLDIDNMAKVYLPVLNQLGIDDDRIHRITMNKRITKTHKSRVELCIHPHSLQHATHRTSP